MDTIDLQNKTEALEGVLESYWFENQSIGLENTLFHRVVIPLKEFDSGLEYETQPVNTAIVLDWYELKLEEDDLDGLNLSHSNYPEAEGSVYVGSAHNWCDVKDLTFTKQMGSSYLVTGNIVVEFENEGVAQNESFTFSTIVDNKGLTKQG